MYTVFICSDVDIKPQQFTKKWRIMNNTIFFASSQPDLNDHPYHRAYNMEIQSGGIQLYILTTVINTLRC